MLILILLGVLLVPVGHLLPDTYVTTLRNLAPLFGSLALVVIMFNNARRIGFVGTGTKGASGVTLGILDTLLATVVLSFTMNLLFNWPYVYGAILGAVLGETATVVVLPVIARLKLDRGIYEMLLMETTTNSVTSILAFALLISVVSSQSLTAATFTNYVVDYISVAVFIGLVFGIVWLFAQRSFRGAKEYLATIAAALLLYGVVSLLNGAAIISILIFAVVIGHRRLVLKLLGLKAREDQRALVEAKATERDLEFLIRTFFFVFIGMIASLSLQYLGYALLITALLLLFRYIPIKIIMRNDKRSQNIVFSLMPRGTTAAVLGAILYGIGGFFSNEMFYITFMVIIVTNVLSAFMVAATRPKTISARSEGMHNAPSKGI